MTEPDKDQPSADSEVNDPAGSETASTASDELALLLREADKSEVQVVNGDVITNAVDLALRTGGLDFQMRTQTSVTAETIDLAARLDATTKQLNDSNAKLEAAMYRIGFLESKLQEYESKPNTSFFSKLRNWFKP